MSSYPYRFTVESIRCKACERRIRNGLAGEPDIESLTVDLATRQLTIYAHRDGLDAYLRSKLHAAGYAPAP